METLEVLEVLQVQRRKRKIVVKQQAATHMSFTGRGRPRRIAVAESLPHVAATASSPGRTGTPENQLARPCRLWAPQFRTSAHFESGQRPGQPALVEERSNIGVKDYGLHRRCSSRIAMTFGIGKGEELFQLLIRLESVCRQLIERPNRLGVLGGEKLLHRQAEPGRRYRWIFRVGIVHIASGPILAPLDHALRHLREHTRSDARASGPGHTG